MYLNTTDCDLLNNAISTFNGHSIADKLDVCKKLCTQMSDKEFPYLYAAILTAKYDKVEEALVLLEYSPTKPFSRELKRYLETNKVFSPLKPTFKDTTPYDVFTQTSYFKDYMDNIIRSIKGYIREYVPDLTAPQPLTIVDVGTGNGVLLRTLLEGIFEIYGFDQINLLLIDKFSEMNELAQANLETQFPGKVNIACIEGEIQNLDMTVLKNTFPGSEIWFINAAACIHHMPKNKKIETLLNLRKLAPHIVVSELNGNHDLPEEDSPEFVYSVTSFYGDYFNLIMRWDGDSVERRHQCIDGFFMAESLTMLGNSRENRIDYHTTIEEWQDIVGKSKLDWQGVSITSSFNGIPASYTFFASNYSARNSSVY